MMSALLAVMLATALAAGQNPAPAAGSDEPAAKSAVTAETPTVDPDSIGISLERIQKAVTRPQGIKLTENRQVFRVEVFGEKPTIFDILGPDFLRGSIPNAPMTHQEFLDMVTPKDVQGYAAFSNTQGMIVAATSIGSIGLQWALQKALDKYRDARNERAKAAATKEVQEALDALRRARRDAGLPDK